MDVFFSEKKTGDFFKNHGHFRAILMFSFLDVNFLSLRSQQEANVGELRYWSWFDILCVLLVPLALRWPHGKGLGDFFRGFLGFPSRPGTSYISTWIFGPWFNEAFPSIHQQNACFFGTSGLLHREKRHLFRRKFCQFLPGNHQTSPFRVDETDSSKTRLVFWVEETGHFVWPFIPDDFLGGLMVKHTQI